MNKVLKFVCLLTFSVTVSAATEEQMIKESQQSIKQFSKQLKSKLQQGMGAGGPINAIKVCHLAAEGISKQISEKFGWKIARTALKVRNSKNNPDEWEKKVLQSFEQRLDAGESIAQIDYAEILDKKTFRYMKAIPTKGLCLSCHGDKLSPAVAKKVDKLYPDDKAKGFKVGDIRGAFSVTRMIN